MAFYFVFVLCYLVLNIRSENIQISGNNGWLSIFEKTDILEVDFLIDDNKAFEYAIYDGFVPFPSTNDDCQHLVEKTKLIWPRKSLGKSNFSRTDLLGHSFVLFKNGQIQSCVTVILKSTKLKYVNFSTNHYFGNIFAVLFTDFIRFLPQISKHSFREKSIIDFYLVSECFSSIQDDFLVDSGTIDIRNISAVDVMLNSSLAFDDNQLFLQIFDQNQSIICKKFDFSRSLIAWTPVLQLEQVNPFTAVKIKDSSKKVKILNCTDKVEIDINNLQLYGKNTAFFDKIEVEGKCLTLFPWKSAQIMMATFLNPIFGKVFIVNVAGHNFLATDLVSVFDENKTNFSVKLSTFPVSSMGCLDFKDNYSTSRTFILEARKEQRSNNLHFYSLESFVSFDDLKSIQVDIGWTKICANLTFIGFDGIKAKASLRSHNIASSRQIALLEILENPLMKVSEVLFDRFEKINDFVFHSRPIDSTITAGPPCSELNIGPKTNLNWTSLLHESFIDKNKTRIIVHGKLLTDSNNILGLSILAQTKNAVACGTIVPEEDERVAIAFFNASVKGHIKMFDNPNNPTIPIRILYFFENDFKNQLETNNKPAYEWEIVSMNGGLCQNTVIFDPFHVKDHNRCFEDLHFCPMGQMLNYSQKLHSNARKFMLLQNNGILEFTATILNLHIRLQTLENQTLCSKLEVYNPLHLRWTVRTSDDHSLPNLQEDLASRFEIRTEQIDLKYTREFFGEQCLVFDMQLLLLPEEKKRILKVFDVQQRRFKADSAIDCNGTTDSASGSAYSAAFPFFWLLLVIFLAF